MLKTQKQTDSLFIQKWKQVYSFIATKQSRSQAVEFGDREHFTIKKDGIFSIARNLTLGGKRVSLWVEEALNHKALFFPFDSTKFNFNKIETKQTIAFVDFQKDALCFDAESINKHQHKIIINGFPFWAGHSLFLPYFSSNLPQTLIPKTLGQKISPKDVLEKALHLKKLLPQAFGVYFNSEGGGSSVNHMHFQLLPSKPIAQQWKITLDNEKGEPLMVSDERFAEKAVNITIFRHLGALFVKIQAQKAKIYSVETSDLIVEILQGLIQVSTELTVPYCLLINSESTIYFVFRNFAIVDVPFGFIQFLEVIISKTEEQFENANDESIRERFKKIELNPLKMNQIKTQVKATMNKINESSPTK